MKKPRQPMQNPRTKRSLKDRLESQNIRDARAPTPTQSRNHCYTAHPCKSQNHEARGFSNGKHKRTAGHEPAHSTSSVSLPDNAIFLGVSLFNVPSSSIPTQQCVGVANSMCHISAAGKNWGSPGACQQISTTACTPA